MRWFLLSALVATAAFAGPRGRVNVNVRFGTPWLGGAGRQQATPQVVYQPVYVPLAWWTWYPIQPQVQQAPPPPPEPIIIEREIIREVPAPQPAPQVIVVEQAPAPAPAVAPAPAPPAPTPEVAKPPPPPAPRVPGPDVFTWIDEDGVTHFSTRVPPEAKARARKVGANKRTE